MYAKILVWLQMLHALPWHDNVISKHDINVEVSGHARANVLLAVVTLVRLSLSMMD